MEDNKILVLSGQEIHTLVDNKEEILEVIKKAYQAHEEGLSSLPHSTFLRFPNNSSSRIIALPAYIGSDFDVAGMKWISSFPSNIEKGIERASACLVLNSTKTGRPKAILEGSLISSLRTAASAALASKYLHVSHEVKEVGIIGCGPIGYQVLNFLKIVWPNLNKIYLYDINKERALRFKKRCLKIFSLCEVEIMESQDELLNITSLICLTTTASTPYIEEINNPRSNTVILHVSLRDLSPDIILNAVNIVDDVSHVCRAQTSIHLAEQRIGNRDFIQGTLGSIMLGNLNLELDKKDLIVFSPFGLGILDIALGNYIYEEAIKNDMGTKIDFFPDALLEI